MTRSRQLATATVTALAVLAGLATTADAAQCGSSAAGFQAWKAQFAEEARAKGVGAGAVSALMGTNYASATIAADRGALSASTRGSMHGEIGQTQFLPKNILAYGTGNLDVAANALNSTANFLKAHGWRAGAGYQPGEANFAAIQAWNAASVYQRAIALIGRQIDGGEGR